MSKLSVAAKRFGGFIKQNATYLLVLLCIASVATVIALAATGNFGREEVIPTIQGPEPDNDTPVVKPDKPNPDDTQTPIVKPDNDKPKQISFCAPCNGYILADYTDTALVWNQTLTQFSTHQGTDYTSQDMKVLAVADGTVLEIGEDRLNGNYIIINHADGYQSRYYSLADGITLKNGESVSKGQQIGNMSTSMAKESLDGNHLHFEMSKDGKDINPLEVINLQEK